MPNERHEIYESYEEEVLYVESQDPKRPGRGFNDDPACFARYVEMQARFARLDGFPKLADRMLAVISTPSETPAESDRRDSSTWPEPTTPQPDVETLQDWESRGGCEATDGCWVEPDGFCPHEHPSWWIRMELI